MRCSDICLLWFCVCLVMCLVLFGFGSVFGLRSVVFAYVFGSVVLHFGVSYYDLTRFCFVVSYYETMKPVFYVMFRSG